MVIVLARVLSRGDSTMFDISVYRDMIKAYSMLINFLDLFSWYIDTILSHFDTEQSKSPQNTA